MAVSTKQRFQPLSARRLIGKSIRDINGETVGAIDDLILDMDTACAQYAVFTSGGATGMNESQHVAPIQSLSMNTDTGDLTISIERSRLRNAPKFNRDHPPDFSDEQWQRDLHSYYGTRQHESGYQTQRGYQGESQGGYQQGEYGWRPSQQSDWQRQQGQQGGYGRQIGRGSQSGRGT